MRNGMAKNITRFTNSVLWKVRVVLARVLLQQSCRDAWVEVLYNADKRVCGEIPRFRVHEKVES